MPGHPAGAVHIPDETDIYSPRRNVILAALPESELASILDVACLVTFKPGETLGTGRDVRNRVLFPISGVISVIIELEDGRGIDTAIVGPEGVAGIPPFVNMETSSLLLAGRIQGRAFAIDSTVFFGQLERSPVLSRQILRFLGFIIGSMSMTLACTRFHETHQQYARWLLDYSDHAKTDCYPMTHAILADTLGVRRATITGVAAQSRYEGIVGGGRGKVCVLDRPRLESMACECYSAIRTSYREMFSKRSTVAQTTTSTEERSSFGMSAVSLVA